MILSRPHHHGPAHHRDVPDPPPHPGGKKPNILKIVQCFVNIIFNRSLSRAYHYSKSIGLQFLVKRKNIIFYNFLKFRIFFF